jgi:hypothetical protein
MAGLARRFFMPRESLVAVFSCVRLWKSPRLLSPLRAGVNGLCGAVEGREGKRPGWNLRGGCGVGEGISGSVADREKDEGRWEDEVDSYTGEDDPGVSPPHSDRYPVLAPGDDSEVTDECELWK